MFTASSILSAQYFQVYIQDLRDGQDMGEITGVQNILAGKHHTFET